MSTPDDVLCTGADVPRRKRLRMPVGEKDKSPFLLKSTEIEQPFDSLFALIAASFSP